MTPMNSMGFSLYREGFLERAARGKKKSMEFMEGMEGKSVLKPTRCCAQHV
jgi:hypothetical protein